MNPRRALLLALAASGLSLPAAIRAALAQSPSPAGGAPVQGMRSLQGDVRVNGRRARDGTPVKAGDEVRTAGDGLAMFVVGQDAFLLRGGTRAQFQGANLAIDVVRIITGKLLGVFAHGGERRLVTPTALIGIRGTGGYLEVQRERTYFCLCYGSVEISSADGSVKDAYSTTHHESPRYIYAASGPQHRAAIRPASVQNHTDAELIMLEALVGRTPPESFMDSPDKY